MRFGSQHEEVCKGALATSLVFAAVVSQPSAGLKADRRPEILLRSPALPRCFRLLLHDLFTRKRNRQRFIQTRHVDANLPEVKIGGPTIDAYRHAFPE